MQQRLLLKETMRNRWLIKRASKSPITYEFKMNHKHYGLVLDITLTKATKHLAKNHMSLDSSDPNAMLPLIFIQSSPNWWIEPYEGELIVRLYGNVVERWVMSNLNIRACSYLIASGLSWMMIESASIAVIGSSYF